MASLSLPRVLQQRKTSLEIERENFEKCQAISIGKAVNQIENPVKEKHVRNPCSVNLINEIKKVCSCKKIEKNVQNELGEAICMYSTIIGTFHEKGGATFWSCVLRLPLQENRIVAWKFCHVLHKVLREGHPHVIPHSQRHRGKIEDLGKLWVHLREGYGKLIQLYCQLLITKLDFHRRNPRFPGNLLVTKEELESIGENDINNYFQMSVEMFDYMDEILNLQSAIFGSLDMSRANSMTSSGQCRLAPLIPCIQDSSQLYDYCVKILFKLHASLPPDTLAGHRDRFLKQFRSLRQFYLSANTLQYFKNLIQIPLLPENPPNFLVQSDLGSYVTPVVILPPEDTSASESDNVDSSSLVDTSDTGSMGELVDLAHRNGCISPDVLAERDNLIEHLQTEISRLRLEIRRMVAEHNRKVEELMERIAELETTLAKQESELLQERQLKDDLLQQTEDVSKYQEMEKKAKATEEKFSKLKDIYTKLREEHVQLIRQKAAMEKGLNSCNKKADVDKQLDKAKTTYEEAEKSKMEAVAKLVEAVNEKKKAEDSLQQASSQAKAELDVLQAAQEAVESEKLLLATKMDWVVNEKSILEGELQDLLSQKEDLDVRLREMEERMQVMETRLHRENLDTLYQLLVTCISQAEAMVKKAVHEVDNPALSAVVCTPDYFQSLPEPVLKSLDDLDSSFAKFISDGTSLQGLVSTVPLMAHLLSTYLIQGKTTSNKSPDIEFGEHIADTCRVVGSESLALLANLKDRDKATQVPESIRTVKSRVGEVADMVAKLSGALKGDSVERIEEMLEDELTAMDKSIEEAAKRIEDMLSKSRQADSGIKLEVNEKILDSCTNLMKAIRLLVQKSRLLQAEIVAQGKGTASAKEFYKRNHQWTEGLISAAKSVGVGAKFLLTAADKVVSGQGKFEQLVVASQEIAASTAQLVVASRVKADRNSSNLLELSKASKGVTQATGQVVATSKSCSQLVDDNEELDVSGLSLHQAKRLEMESQVRVIELEASLQQERLRLSALRRQHYQLAGEVEGWDPVAIKENV